MDNVYLATPRTRLIGMYREAVSGNEDADESVQAFTRLINDAIETSYHDGFDDGQQSEPVDAVPLVEHY